MSILTKLENLARELARRNQTFRKLVRGGRTRFHRARFNVLKTGEVEEKLVFFTSFAGRSYGDSPKAIYEYMLNDNSFAEYSFVWMFQNPENYDYLLKNRNTQIVKQNSGEELIAMGKAKYWITNYRLLDQFIPSEKQIYVQCWHGTPLKKLGYDLTATGNAMNDLEEIREKYRTDAERFKYLLSPAPVTTGRLISAWNLKAMGKESAIIEEGYPRNDRLAKFDEKDRTKMLKELGLTEDKTIILYAPTWRDNQFDSNLGYTYTNQMKFDRFLEHLGPKYVILFRAHYLVANSFDFEKYNGSVIDVSKVDDINDLIIASDMLITDYSSVMFDYAITGKPMVFYMYDLYQYSQDIRGLYSGLDEIPGPIIAHESELVEKVKAMPKEAGVIAMPEEYREKYNEFNKRYNLLNDGGATERVVNKIFEDR